MARISRQLAVTLMSSSWSKTLGSRCVIGVSTPSTAALARSASSRPQRSKIEAPSRSMPRHVLEAQRHQGGAAAGILDFVIDFLQPANGAGEADDMRAGGAQRDGGGAADAFGGPCHQGDLTVQHFDH